MYHLTKIIWNKQACPPNGCGHKEAHKGYRLIGEAHKDEGKFRQLAVHIEKGADTPENICDSINHIIEYYKNR